VAGISVLFTAPSIPGWYAALSKPSFNPPNQAFGPVWTVLYAAMAVAVWIVWKSPASLRRTQGVVLFCVQLALNFAWSAIFFYAHRIGAAFLDIALLWLAILATLIVFFAVRRAAGWLMLPYLIWVSFAAILNWSIWKLN
jgi:tryptophan-rich sensory protein